MKRQLSIVLLAVIVCACAPSFVTAATVILTVDGQSYDVPNYWVPDYSIHGGAYVVGDPNNPGQQWVWSAEGVGEVKIGGTLDPDPTLGFNASVTDFGAPSNFGFVYSMALNPVVPNPSTVFDSLAGSVTNGPDDDGGVNVTALPPPLNIPTDGDMVTEIQVFTLSTDGVNWQNVGLDSGPSAFIPLGPSNSLPYPHASNQGPIATIPSALPWTHMRADINFGLSGFGDVFSFNGAKVLNPIPEPSAVLLGLIAATLGCGLRRRF
jgi:hypothetical protein